MQPLSLSVFLMDKTQLL